MCKARIAGEKDGRKHLKVLPDIALTSWHLAQAKLSAIALTCERNGRVEFQGARYRKVWAWWAPDHRNHCLYIGRIHIPQSNGLVRQLRALLTAAMIEALISGLREVIIWDPCDQVVKAAQSLRQRFQNGVDAVKEDRLDMIPCVRWLNGQERNVVWREKDYASWS